MSKTVIKRGQGKIAFLADQDIVTMAVEAGCPLTFIYENYAYKFNISYSQFSRYVARYITGTKKKKKPVRKKITKPSDAVSTSPAK